MIYTYYYGVLCVKCKKFIMLNEYQTLHPLGLVDVTLNIAIRWSSLFKYVHLL
jgi:hypothetical protein